jgi:putative ABC transport system permease protein
MERAGPPAAALILLLIPFVTSSTSDKPWVGVLVFAVNVTLFLAFRGLLDWGLRTSATHSGKLPLALQLAMGEISSRRLTSLLTMALIGIGIFFVSLMSFVQSDMATSLSSDLDTQGKPNVFFLDVQKSQSEEIEALIRSTLDGGEPGQQGPQDLQGANSTREIITAPMVRARLTQIDGLDASVQASENEPNANSSSQGMRQREQNLTWRDFPGPGERVTSGGSDGGLWIIGDHAQVSLEARFADRIGARLGSQLEFSLSGVPLRAKVVSIREVNWQSFRPNFFVIMHPTLMEGVPHQVLMSTHVGSKGERRKLQNEVTRKLPNVSVIDATTFIDRAAGIAKSVAGTSSLLSGLLILAALLILTVTMIATSAARLRTGAILRALGAPARTIQHAVTLEFLILGGASAALGVAAAQITAWIVVSHVLELDASVQIGSSAALWAAATCATMLTGYLTSRAVLTQRPAAILREAL